MRVPRNTVVTGFKVDTEFWKPSCGVGEGAGQSSSFTIQVPITCGYWRGPILLKKFAGY